MEITYRGGDCLRQSQIFIPVCFGKDQLAFGIVKSSRHVVAVSYLITFIFDRYINIIVITVLPFDRNLSPASKHVAGTQTKHLNEKSARSAGTRKRDA